MEFLKETEKFGTKFKKGDDLQGFLGKLLSFIERKFFFRISQRVNYLLKRVNDNKLEIIPDANSDKDTDGNWKFTTDTSGNLIIQENISGTWTDSGWKLDRSP